MRNNKPILPQELKVGMRVKIPIKGNFFNKKKKSLWFKGTIIDISNKYLDIKSLTLVTGVVVSLRTGHGYNKMGTWLILGDNLNYIYKQL